MSAVTTRPSYRAAGHSASGSQTVFHTLMSHAIDHANIGTLLRPDTGMSQLAGGEAEFKPRTGYHTPMLLCVHSCKPWGTGAHITFISQSCPGRLGLTSRCGVACPVLSHSPYSIAFLVGEPQSSYLKWRRLSLEGKGTMLQLPLLGVLPPHPGPLQKPLATMNIHDLLPNFLL